MRTSRGWLGLLLLLAACNTDKPAGSKASAETDDGTPAGSGKVFSCKKVPEYCAEHTGEETWSPIVVDGCTKAGGTWVESPCSRDGVSATCTKKRGERTTISFFYEAAHLPEGSDSVLCKDGTWEQKVATVPAR